MPCTTSPAAPRTSLLEEAPRALAALERAAERARLAGEGIAGTVRLGYAPTAGFETLGAILAAVEQDTPNVTVIASEFFSAEIPGRVLAGELDVGVALHPEPMRGVRNEPLRMEPHVVLVSRRHRLAGTNPISLNTLEHETLLLFARELAPAYYYRIMVGLPPASLGSHAAGAEPALIALEIASPGIVGEWSILWAARDQSAATVRRPTQLAACARETAQRNRGPSRAPR